MTRNTDIAIILTVHDDARYLRRTLDSLEQAAAYAAVSGLTTELLLVADRPSGATADWIQSYRAQSFRSARCVVVDHGDPGLSRDAGLALADTTYATFADGDDLASYNILAEMHKCLVVSDAKSVCFPNYVREFGARERVVALFDLQHVGPSAFFNYHPYNSRLMGKTALLRDFKHAPTPAGSGLAFEDWHFNNELLAAGFDFKIAKDTILFYRKSERRRNAEALSMGRPVPPLSQLHSSRTFVAVSSMKSGLAGDQKARNLNRPHLVRSFVDSQTCRELVLAENLIEPAINVAKLRIDACATNVPARFDAAECYRKICQQLGDKVFDQVVLVPFIVNAGAEKYIFSILNEIKETRHSSRILFLSLDHWDKHAWLDRLPAGSKFVDIRATGPDISESDLYLIMLRVIQVFAPDSLLHIKACHSAQQFLVHYGHVLAGCRFVYYRFCEMLTKSHLGWVPRADKFSFLSEHGSMLDLIVYDNNAQAVADTARLDFLASKVACIYNKTDVPEHIADIARPFSRRLLWASRLDPQKRPDILIKVCKAVAVALPDVHIDIWGFTIREKGQVDLSGLSNATYKGPYDGFSALPRDQYDGIVYTSAFDGMPNIVLECMADGISVIAPDVGGIAEAIGPLTGYPLPNSPDDDELVRSYVSAVESLYANHGDAVARRKNARQHIKLVHGQARFRREVRQLFGPLLERRNDKRDMRGRP